MDSSSSNGRLQLRACLNLSLKKWASPKLPPIAPKMPTSTAKAKSTSSSIKKPEVRPATLLKSMAHLLADWAFAFRDAHKAYPLAIERGAQPLEIPTGPMELRLPAVKGIGGAPLYLIDRYGEGASIYDIDFNYIDGVDRNPTGCGFKNIDHLTHNVYRGRMDYWAKFYEDVFGFRQVRFFDIKGEYTGLKSRAMSSPDGKIRIPLNEESSGSSGQIEEFLMEYNGEGIQHVAFASDDLLASWDALKANGLPFMTAPPQTYYEMVEERLPDHGEPLEELQKRGILLDGSTLDNDPRLLLQIFSQTQVGPVFFEFIQRKRDEGFGEGNFKALFESMERDQIERGVLDTTG